MVAMPVIRCLNPLFCRTEKPSSFTAPAVNLKGSSVAIAEEIKGTLTAIINGVVDDKHLIGLGIARKAPLVVIDLLGLLAVLPGLRDRKSPIQKGVVLSLLGSFGCGVGVGDDIERVKKPVNFLPTLIDCILLDVGI